MVDQDLFDTRHDVGVFFKYFSLLWHYTSGLPYNLGVLGSKAAESRTKNLCGPKNQTRQPSEDWHLFHPFLKMLNFPNGPADKHTATDLGR